MKKLAGFLVIILLLAGVIVLFASAYTVPETKQAIITQFGKPVGDPVTEAGLHFRTPFVQDVNTIEKRILEWDGLPTEMPTKDKTYIQVDTFGRWRISDAKQFFLRLRDERSAQSRLNDILGSETRNAIAKHELIEVIRTTKDRVPSRDSSLVDTPGNIGILYPITLGRAKIEEEIFEKAADKLTDFGIELLDVRFKRINYNNSVRQRIYERMISERQQIAERFRSEGAGEAAKIAGKKERDLQEIESEAYKRVQTIRGEADARATEIYANAFNQSANSVEYYEFVKTLETYQKMLNSDTTLILSTNSDLFKFLKEIEPNDQHFIESRRRPAVLNVIKILVVFLGVCSFGFFLARWADQLGNNSPQAFSIADRSDSEAKALGQPEEVPANPVKGPMEAIVGSFLELQQEEGVFTLERKLTALSLDELEEFYIEALSFDLEDRRAYEAASLALQSIASQDPRRALELLYALTPSEKSRLATALSDGWARYDAVSAWDWIDSAWIDANGEYIDRDLQNRMFHGTLEVVLSEQRNYQLATDLLSSVVEPGLRLELADLIAFYVVSENPAQTLARLDFTSNAMVDSAIMDAVIDEWAQRDSLGAMAWTLGNQDQVTIKGARLIAKDLVLNGVYEALENFHLELQSSYKRDSVASESARLLARRNPNDSVSWLAAIESSATKYNAYYDSLYEIGHDDFDSSVRYAELASGIANLDREDALFEALQGWAVISPSKVQSYLESSDDLSGSDRLSALVEGAN